MTGHEQHSYAARPAARRGSVVAALAIPVLFATACSTAYFGAGELNQAGGNGGATGGDPESRKPQVIMTKRRPSPGWRPRRESTHSMVRTTNAYPENQNRKLGLFIQ